jgi:hypothetical protein
MARPSPVIELVDAPPEPEVRYLDQNAVAASR